MKKILFVIMILMPLAGFASQAEEETLLHSLGNTTPLHLLARKGDPALLEGALTILNCLIDQRDAFGLTPLCHAIMLGHTGVADILIRHGAQTENFVGEANLISLHALVTPPTSPDIVDKVLRWHNHNGYSFLDLNAQDKDGDTPLHNAIRLHQPETALALLDHNPNIYIMNNHRNTALFYACKNNFVAVALKIASLWDRTKKKTTPLHIAAWANNASIIKELVLKQQWNLEARNREGTPLFSALLHGNCQAADTLIQCGARTDDLKNSLQATPLHMSVIKGDVEDVENLLVWLRTQNEPVIDVNEPHLGMSPRQLAERFLQGEKQRKMIALIEKFAQRQDRSSPPLEQPSAHARPSQQETDPTTLLHVAARFGLEPVIRIELSMHPQSINTKDSHGRTALFIALSNGHIECAQLLIEHGACTTSLVASPQQYSPMHALAIEATDTHSICRVFEWQNRHNYHILDVNAKTDSKYTPLMFVINRPENKGREEIVDELLRRNADIYCKDDQGIDALRYALEKGYTEIALKIARRWNSNTAGKTVLHIAAEAGNVPALNRMIEELQPEDLDAGNSHGDSPLFEALKWGHTEVADVLLRHGARSTNLANKYGMTPLHIVLVCSNNPEIVKKLLTWQQQKNDKILDVNKKDFQGDSPLKLARYFLHGEDLRQVTSLLISLGARDISDDDSGTESSSRYSMPLRILHLLRRIHVARQEQERRNHQRETRQTAQTRGDEILEEVLNESPE